MQIDPISDNAIMIKVKSGDLASLGILFERYNKILFGFFFRITSNRDVSEDLVQITFERILKYRKQFRGEGKFYTWMYSISRNVLADHFKRNKRRGISVELNEHHENLGSLHDNDDSEWMEEKHLVLKLAMEKLDEEKRELLILSRYQGLKYKEIAELMESTEGAIRIKIFRALNDLRKIYQKLEKTELI